MKEKSKIIRAAEWLDALPDLLKKKWPVIAVILAIAVCLIICLAMLFGWAGPGSDIDAVQKQIIEEMGAKIEASEAKVQVLEAELFEIQEQIAEVDARIEASITERNEVHDEIDTASGVAGVNTVLRRHGITGPGSTGKTAKPNIDTRGVDSNPYN